MLKIIFIVFVLTMVIGLLIKSFKLWFRPKALIFWISSAILAVTLLSAFVLFF